MAMPMRSLLPFSWNRNVATEGRSDPFVTLQQEMNRLFDNFTNVPSAFGNFSGDFGKASISPRIDVSETDKQVEIEAELPGLSEKDIEVTVSGDLLTLRGERHDETEEKRKNYFISERSYGSFFRSIALPFDAEPGDISAHFDKGVLKVIVKKPATVSAKTAKIPVRAGA